MTQLVLLGGFLGAGKTTTMLAAARLLSAQGQSVSVVTNDQATGLVDTALARRTLPLVDEITGGCFCCRFEDLDEVVRRLVDAGVDTVIAEAVGSCTDLQATVVRPLRRFYGTTLRLAPLTTLVDPRRFLALIDDQSDLGYLFRLQLTESDIIVLNKRDLHTVGTLEPIERRLREQFPAAVVRTCSAATTDGMAELVDAWSSGTATALDRDLEVDYDRYAAAEAELAWLNHSIALLADEKVGTAFAPGRWADHVLRELAASCDTAGYDIGHAKLSIVCDAGLVKLSVPASGVEPTVDATVEDLVARATATVNLRVACPPDELNTLARNAIASADRTAGVHSDILAGAAFQPAYPRPTHRIPA